MGRSGGLAYKWIVAIVVIIGVFMSILDQTIIAANVRRSVNGTGMTPLTCAMPR